MELVVQTAPVTLPGVAERAPHRAVGTDVVAGQLQIFAWDAQSGRSRQVTRRRIATSIADIDPTGQVIWWFDDDLGGRGRWRVQPFGGGEHADAFPGFESARHAGLAMADDGCTAAGLATETGFELLLRLPDSTVRIVPTPAEAAELIDLEPGGRLLAVGGGGQGRGAISILTSTGEPVVTLHSAAGQRLWPVGFSPDDAEPTLLLIVEDLDGYRLATWTETNGYLVALQPRYDSEISASWCPDGRVLIRQDRHGRGRLELIDLLDGSRRPVPVPPGTVLEARVRQGRELHYVWTDADTPPELRRGTVPARSSARPDAGPIVADEAARDARPGRRLDGSLQPQHLWAPSTAGPVPFLLTAPTAGDASDPAPTVFLLHGGPHTHDRDAYDPLITVLAASGIAVARVNYRGSTGYGPRWRAAGGVDVGHAQLADVAAVRGWLIEHRYTAADRCGLAGWSWGGYLALLGIGAQPELWTCAAAAYPIADYPAAFAAAPADVRAVDLDLFGGSPDEVPGAYRRASPLTYIDDVRAPVLLVAGRADRRCAPEQAQRYAERLAGRGVRAEFEMLDAGHGALDQAVATRELLRVVGFLGAELSGAEVLAPA